MRTATIRSVRQELDETYHERFDGWGGQRGNVRLDYRPVHEYTLTGDIAYIEPKKRVY